MPLANVAQYRKSIGKFNSKPRPPSEKSIRKAIRKAHRSHESINTRSNSCYASGASSCAIKALFVVALAASLVGTSAAISNGQLKENSEIARATFPYLGLAEFTDKNVNYHCSSIRINDRQVLTAKHCAKDSFHPWSWSNDWRDINRAVERLNYPNENVDLAILTFETDLRAEARCVPIMSKKTQALLKASPKNICGLKGRIITLGNGVSEDAKEYLHSGIFDFANENNFKRKISNMKGVVFCDKPVHTNGGDSGGAVMGCNPLTKQYELMGMNVAGSWERGNETPNGKLSWFVDIAQHSEISDWIMNNTKSYSCTGQRIKNEELYEPHHHDYSYANKYDFSNTLNFVGLSLISLTGVACLGAAYCYKKDDKEDEKAMSVLDV